MTFQRVGHGAERGGGAAGCETMGTATGKGKPRTLSRLRCTDVNERAETIVSHVGSPAC